MKGCIYIIHCGSQKVYVGATLNLKNRRHDHLNKLRMGIHRNKSLQSDFDSKGEKHYNLSVIERNVYPDDLEKQEFFWIGMFKHVHNKLNTPIIEREEFIRTVINPRCIRIRKPVVEIDLDGNLIAEYDSVYQCHKVTGIAKSNLHTHLNYKEKVKHLRGRIFKFKSAC